MTNIVAKIGQNPTFIAFNAHCWFAYAIVYTLPWHAALALGVVAAAAVKEFWFDAHYETNPPQTAVDNLTDWLGYCFGVLLAMLAVVLL